MLIHRRVPLLPVLLLTVACDRSVPAPPPRTPAPLPSPGQPVVQQEPRFAVLSGSVAAPAGTVNQRTGGSVDVFFGYLQLPHSSLRLLWASGSLLAPSKEMARAVSPVTELLPACRLQYVRYRKDGRQVIEASVPRTRFLLLPASEDDVQTFLRIVRTYEPGPCPTCIQPLRPTPPAT
jgi:hypothetical protein